MELTLQRIYNMASSLRKLIQQEVPVKVAYQLAKNVRVIDDEYQLIEKQRADLIRKHGEVQEDGSTRVADENVAAFTKEMAEYLRTSTEVDVKSVSISDLGDNCKLTPQEVIDLEGLLVE
ncbi:MAG: hypothetical protein UT24_C0018G0020 [Candidatus Woesebacteria bacterium GW2011_GWB1_39_12]|uniref:Uncharacterized protein n=1 Tax=Candidatus Woesebacteria bacterium GW2011_GWB1_39_12 TaxID=1618574 RepID=A0A0G0M9V3_9BACT|nr:MAG: hypothetical protein UT24_C0018G0020 [Candidatus Woesebacteria bacterium GW2011_GWB1_39_12]